MISLQGGSRANIYPDSKKCISTTVNENNDDTLIYLAFPSTNLTSVRTANPVAPPFLSSHTGPAISRWAHGAFLTNSWRKSAAVIDPPPPGAPRFLRSASAALSSPLRPSSLLHWPAYLGPRATMHAPVSV